MEPGVVASTSRRLLAAHAVLLAAIAILVTDALLYTQNTLHQNGRWSSAKVELVRGVIGAVATLVTRVPVRRNRLDLGAYLGFQQFWLEESRSVRQVSFSFRADGPVYLDVLFGPDREGFAGVRLSLHPNFRSVHFAASGDGEFLEADPLPLGSHLATDSWIRASARFGLEMIELAIDGEPVASFRHTGVVQALGFRGSMGGPLLDDIEVVYRDGPPLIETFANGRRRGLTLTFVSLVVVSLAALAFALLRRAAGVRTRHAHLTCLVGYLVILVSVAMATAVDRLHFSGLYPSDYRAMSAAGYPNRIERTARTLQRLERKIALLPDDGRLRILLIGGSQTWGAGARRPADTWARVLERALNGAGREVAVVNAGVSGARAEYLLKHYRRIWHRAEPDLIVAILGHNDEAGPEFEKALEGFANESRARGVPIVFVLEPNSTETPTRVGERHAVIRRVALQTGAPVVDMYAYLDGRREAGHVWWDSVHLTSYGQRLFGEELARALEPLLADVAPRPGPGVEAAESSTPKGLRSGLAERGNEPRRGRSRDARRDSGERRPGGRRSRA